MMSSNVVVTAFLLVLVAALSTQAQSQTFKDRGKAVGDDPTTNTILANFSERLPRSDERRARTIHLALLLATSCQRVVLNEALLSREISRFEARPTGDRARAITLTNPSFDYLDIDAIAHLCSGVNYLFGRSGRMMRGLMSPGSGELAPLHHLHRFHIHVPRELFGG